MFFFLYFQPRETTGTVHAVAVDRARAQVFDWRAADLKNGPKSWQQQSGSLLFKVFYVKRVALSLNLPTAAAAAVELFLF